ncbi:MAG: protein kinase [Planctomycetes bacterium]|nr:protein kinase [Planctomycetota bacterium]
MTDGLEPNRIEPSAAPTPAAGARLQAEADESVRDTDRPPAGATPGPASATDAGREPPKLIEAQSFGDFELLEEIGRGGMGVVYKARQKSLDRIVALKMLLGEQHRDSVWLKRFLAEARAAAQLGHPNIVRIFQVGECPNGHYFAMEFLEGHTLDAMLRKGPISILQAVTVLIPVTEAVHYAHTKGIVHRDLKPANIIVDRFRRPIVMDFGIAKFVGRSSTLTNPGVGMGTPAFMPPEQAGEDPTQVGPHSDVYSLGAILYAALAGRPPYEGTTALNTLLKVISPEPPPAVRSLRREVPAELENICMICLSKKPADRYPSAQALAEALRRFYVAHREERSLPRADTAPAVTLVVTATGKELKLSKAVTVIGRSSKCDIVLKAPDVSKQHCQILLEADQVEVEDLDSANGTFVNGRRIRRAPLGDGFELRVAQHCFRVRA